MQDVAGQQDPEGVIGDKGGTVVGLEDQGRAVGREELQQSRRCGSNTYTNRRPRPPPGPTPPPFPPNLPPVSSVLTPVMQSGASNVPQPPPSKGGRREPFPRAAEHPPAHPAPNQTHRPTRQFLPNPAKARHPLHAPAQNKPLCPRACQVHFSDNAPPTPGAAFFCACTGHTLLSGSGSRHTSAIKLPSTLATLAALKRARSFHTAIRGVCP